jgi:hypothetical protein
MRLNRLDLIRYGLFHDASLDFGPPLTGLPDVAVSRAPTRRGRAPYSQHG